MNTGETILLLVGIVIVLSIVVAYTDDEECV